MKYKLLLTSLFISSFSALPAQACPPGDSQSTAYIRRDDNRCEGIQRREVAGGINLISLVTRGISSYPNPLTLQIPRLGNDTPRPKVKVESLDKNYLLDDLSLILDQSRFIFRLKPDILNQAAILPNTLRALAEVNLVYLPVTIGQPSAQYEFVFYTSLRAKFSTFEVLHNGKVVHRNPRNDFQDGEVVFNWDGRKDPAGRYKVHYIAEIQRIGRPPDKVEQIIDFEHNPNWLK